MENNYIQRIEVHGFWGKHDIVWDKLNPDVNILVGINGSGKSTLLRIIEAIFGPTNIAQRKTLGKSGISSVNITNGDNFSAKYENGVYSFNHANIFNSITTINTFDVPVNKSKLKQEESPLMLELRQLILQTGSQSFNDYRLLATTSPNKAKEIAERIKLFFSTIDNLFSNTGKKIEIDSTNNIIFKSDSETISLEQLSSGEKQLLLILFKVFLMDNKPYILLMDEPEISLHISWQQNLIKTLRELNPNCQLIIATHSPSIFGKGWGDKIAFMETLFQK